MVKVWIKPLSVNEAFKGRRFKTDKYKQYDRDLSLMLPKITINGSKKLSVYYEFGLSSKNADGDNYVKETQDIISRKYGFNDKMIFEWRIRKVEVKKGQEYVKFKINYINGYKTSKN